MVFLITHNSRYGYYSIQTNSVEVKLNKDEMGLPYIDANKPQDLDFVKTVWVKFEGITKKEIVTVKLAQKYQGMIDHTSEKYFKSMLRKT